MIIFLISIAILVVSYFVYGNYIERRFGADKNPEMPAIYLFKPKANLLVQILYNT